MTTKAIQDYYRDEFAHCFGCGRLNKGGLQIKSHWDGEESVCHLMPKPYFTGGYPGYLYGGLIASLIDCHSAATASAAKLREGGFSLDEQPLSRFVTASLKIDYLKPTPMGKALELRGRIKEIIKRKVIVNVELSSEGEIRAKGEVILVQLPESD
ncbi:MAG: PaaI family thioesterase [Syntrophales bacterium]|jgi:acyl-coenzyme A thioesterase PaaI-like protein|nr:PaaI family thioesterase [Syntrophales bacterium]